MITVGPINLNILETIEEEDMKLKHEIVVLGSAKAGKTQLINRLSERPFEERYSITQGVESKKAEKDDRVFWFRDVSASAPSNLIGKPFKTAHEVYLVFDSSDPEGLKKLKDYLSTLNLGLVDKKITLIGTHVDLEQTVSTEEIVAYAKILNADYVQFSSKQANHPSIAKLTETSMQIEIKPRPDGIKRRNSFSSDYEVDLASTGSGNQGKLPGLTAEALRRHEEQALFSSKGQVDLGLTSSDAVIPRKNSAKKIGSPNKHSDDGKSRRGRRKEELSPNYSAAHRQNTTSQLHGSQQRPKPSSTWCSFALRMAGMAMILAGIIGLIYIALIIGNILTLHSLIALTNHIVTGIGALVGASASTSIATFGNVCANAGVSATTAASTMVAGISLGVGALGLCLFRAGKAPQSDDPNPGASLEMARR